MSSPNRRRKIKYCKRNLNQAAITGESLSVEKNPGDKVYAGTLNENGALGVRATQIGEWTTLGQIRRMVLETQESKAPIERILNRYAKFYTPAAAPNPSFPAGHARHPPEPVLFPGCSGDRRTADHRGCSDASYRGAATRALFHPGDCEFRPVDCCGNIS